VWRFHWGRQFLNFGEAGPWRAKNSETSPTGELNVSETDPCRTCTYHGSDHPCHLHRVAPLADGEIGFLQQMLHYTGQDAVLELKRRKRRHSEWWQPE
jgi:hypothetical protein